MNLGLAKALDRVAGRALAGALGAADAVAGALGPPPPSVEDVRTVLVQKYWGVGNWALLRPVLRDLRARWPGARFLAVTLEGNRALVEDAVDEVVLLRPRGLAALAGDLARALRRVRRAAPELSLDFEQFASASALLARAAGVPQRLGFASGSRARDGLLTAVVPFRRDAHAARSFRDLAEAAGVPRGPYVPGALGATARGRAEARGVLESAGLRGAGPLVVLHPGSGDNFPGRRWSPAGFAAVGRLAVTRHAARVAVTGGAAEAGLCAAVASAIGPGAASVAGRTGLEGLLAVLEASRAVVSNDTGPVHLASALGRPVLALFGPNTPVLYGPLSEGSRAFFVGLPCSPCLTTDNYRSSRCRLHTCMAAIGTGEVATALDRLLSRAPAEVPCAPPSA